MEKLRRKISLMRHRLLYYEGSKFALSNIGDELLYKTGPKKNSKRQNFERQYGSDWNEFEFCTKKKGAHGPTKRECLEYYSEK